MIKPRIYCPYCANQVVRREMEGKVRDFCIHCSTIFYENPLPIVSCIVVNENREIVLVKRKNEPYKDMWCLPIGFAEADEEVKDAALRELEEEAGITGEIVRLIDVDTVDNYFYGSLAIIAYEVKQTGGTLNAGDDAKDARRFPIFDLPPLAWASNDKAVQIYIDYYRDSWAMIDSYRQLFPEIESVSKLSPEAHEQRTFLSNMLVKIIDKNSGQITRDWSHELRTAIPGILGNLDFLIAVNKKILKGVKDGLGGKKNSLDFFKFKDIGKDLKRLGIPLPDILNAMALSRKHIWMHVVKQKILSSPLEIYITLEFNNRIIFLYDKINYFLSSGYMSQ
jgi:8-oxo-dGTP diphosphatase